MNTNQLRRYIDLLNEADSIPNPYADDPKQAAIYASLSPEDQEWATRGGGRPDLTDPYIANRAPNKFTPVAKAAPAKMRGGTAPAQSNSGTFGNTESDLVPPNTEVALPSANTFSNDDAVAAAFAQQNSNTRCAVCGTPQNQHQNLKHKFKPGGNNPPAPVTQGSATAGSGNVGRIKQLQRELKQAGANLGKTGAGRDGIDGDLGPLTKSAMSKYPDIAAKYADLGGSAPATQAATPAQAPAPATPAPAQAASAEKAEPEEEILPDTRPKVGKDTAKPATAAPAPAPAPGKLDAALTAIEGILSKYKGKLKEDREFSTTDQMKQWRRLVELTQADMDTAAANRKAAQSFNQSQIDAKFAADAKSKNFGGARGQTAQAMPYSQAAQQASTAAAAEKAAATAGKGAVRTASGALAKKALGAIPGVGAVLGAQDAYKRSTEGDYVGAGISGLAGIASMFPVIGTAISLGLAGTNVYLDLNKTPTVAISAEDAKIIADNVKILIDWQTDPANQAALTPELKTRIANVLKAALTVGVPIQTSTPEVPNLNVTLDQLDKLLKKNNFESKFNSLSESEQLARYRDIVNEGPSSWVAKNVIAPTAKFAWDKAIKPGWDNVIKPVGNAVISGTIDNIIKPAVKLTTQAATLGGLTAGLYYGYEWWKDSKAPKTMNIADQAEFTRLLADLEKILPDRATADALPPDMQEKLIAISNRVQNMRQQGNK